VAASTQGEAVAELVTAWILTDVHRHAGGNNDKSEPGP
jgi:hypothetical protein